MQRSRNISGHDPRADNRPRQGVGHAEPARGVKFQRSFNFVGQRLGLAIVDERGVIPLYAVYPRMGTSQ